MCFPSLSLPMAEMLEIPSTFFSWRAFLPLSTSAMSAVEAGSSLSFIKASHDWEVDDLASFFTLLYSYRVRREGEDKL
jgi:hypothetical protein